MNTKIGLRWCLLIACLGFATEVRGEEFKTRFPETLAGRDLVDSDDYVSDEIIVKFKDQVKSSKRGSIMKRMNLSESRPAKSKARKFRRFQADKGRDVKKLVKELQADENVEYAELNYKAHTFMVPNDTYYSYQWNFYNASYGGVHMPEAWDIETGDTSIIVAVIDTGVAYESYNGYVKAPDLTATNFVAGYNFVNDTTHANDDNGHGTHVSGTIAQSTNNYLGIAGIAFNCSIMPVKVLDSSGNGSYSDIADAIYFAADNGAKVINMSLGGEYPSLTMANALAYAYNQGVTIVCAAGNDYSSGNNTQYPAAYNDYCIAVGATRYDEQRSYYSNTGSYLDIAAPGGDVTVDQNNDGYGDGILQQTFGLDPTAFGYWFYQGTSMATPHVAGAAALLASKGVSNPDKIRLALEESADDIGVAGWDTSFGHGLLNVASALSYKVTGDVNGDLEVDHEDLQIMSGEWLAQSPPAYTADLNEDGIVNLPDFAAIANNWLF